MEGVITIKELTRIRKSLGLTQKRLADLMHKDQRTISGYETGKIQPPLDFLQQLCQQFGLKIVIDANMSIREEHSKMDNMKDKIYDFLINTLSSEDFLQEELISYEDIIENYKDRLPDRFEHIIKEREIPTDRIVGVITKDEFEELIIYFLRDRDAIIMHVCRHEETLDAELDLYGSKLDPYSNPYVYYNNGLWSVYLQRDKDNLTKEDILEVLHSRLITIFSVDEYKVLTNYLIENIEIDLLKTYAEDISMWMDEVTVVRERYIDYEDNLRMDLFLKRSEKYSRTTRRGVIDTIKIPSNEIIICAKNYLSGEMEIIVKPDYFDYLIKGNK